jgi:urea transport system substrate-binding protein
LSARGDKPGVIGAPSGCTLLVVKKPRIKGMAAQLLRTLLLATLLLGFAGTAPRAAEEPIRIGILHSLTGTMALSETTLKDVMVMLVEQQNARGGVLGRPLEAVVVDPASDWDLFAARARELVEKDRVAAIFGGWTSASRKAMLPALDATGGLLFYPLQYEGQESHGRVFYTGAAPNQQALPAIDYLADVDGVTRWVLVGTDYVYPRTTFAILAAYLAERGVPAAEVSVHYMPFAHADWAELVGDIKRRGREGPRTAVISAVNGDANLHFYRELARQGVDGADIPVLALSVGEEEISGIDAATVEGHLAAWNYFQSVDDPRNRAFIDAWHEFTGDPLRVTNDPMEAHYIGFTMWVDAVERAGTADPDAVIAALVGTEVPNLSGGVAVMLPNHHVTKPALVGEMRDDGQFEILWRSLAPIPGDAWTDHLPESRRLRADWRSPGACGAFDTETRRCVAPPAGEGPR